MTEKPLAYDAYESLAEDYAARVDTKPHNAYYDRPAILSLAVAFLSSLAVVFTRAGRIRLEEDRLVVSTPLGFSKIPYSSIETIRRCRRSGSAKRQYLQIIFDSPGERKIVQLRPHHLLEFTAQLRRKCPHLSSSSDACLVKQGGHDRLIHSA